MRARASPILHALFNAARDGLVFTCDFLHCTLRSGIVDLPGFHADFLSVEPPKIGIVSKRAHQLRSVPADNDVLIGTMDGSPRWSGLRTPAPYPPTGFVGQPPPFHLWTDDIRD
jgi:hypothetical protein